MLRSTLDVACEGFASPLNAYIAQCYGSAFADTDAPFGSRGSFYLLRPSAGSFAVHPPPVPTLMDTCATHVNGLLDAATKATGDHALSFVVALPGWQQEQSQAYGTLSDSAHLIRRIHLVSDDHGLLEDEVARQRQVRGLGTVYGTRVGGCRRVQLGNRQAALRCGVYRQAAPRCVRDVHDTYFALHDATHIYIWV